MLSPLQRAFWYQPGDSSPGKQEDATASSAMKESVFTAHLHSHSCYSFLSGIPSPAQLAQAAAAEDMASLALTDQHGLTGAIEFYDACRSAGVRPILGLELPVAAPPNGFESGIDPLVLLAMDMPGWAGLCRLSSALQANPERDPARGLPFDDLAAHTSGLICLTGGARGLLTRIVAGEQESAAAHYLHRLHELFADRLYVMLERHSPAARDDARVDRLAALARRLALPVAAAHDIHYLSPEQSSPQRTLAAMRLNCPLAELPADAPAPQNAHWLTPAQMAERFADLPAALAATREIADRCRLELPLGRPHYPEIPLPPGVAAIDVLRQKSDAGARRLYGEITSELRARLDHELAVIGERGYAPLFLIMEEIMAYARQTDVPVSSRGSAASSLVAHCLGITSPDPMRLNLYFERFLNPARATPPDIDTDLCSRRRDGVIQHVFEKYGHDRAAMVCTINRFRDRSALREVAKAHGLPPDEVKTLAEALPYRGWGPYARENAAPYAELSAQYPSPLHQQIFRDAAALLGAPHHLSVHPGGVVIAPGPLTDLVPVQWSSKGVIITQFDLDSVARLGLIKIDLLGIRGLTVLGDVADAVRAAQPGNFSSSLDVLDAIPADDSAVKDLVRTGRTIGCFQIESPGMRAVLKEIQAQSVDDLMIALALYRPGPLTGGLKDKFVRRHLRQEPTEHLHPALAPLLDDTYGVILYQEQVLRIAHGLAGLSLAEADLLRRAMSHFDPGKQMQTLKENFVAGAQARSGVPAETAERVWELMAAFAGYGFPKAHAASYAVVGWRAAWCKAHLPAEFMASVLANWGGYYPQRVYLTEARRMGLRLRPPHVNHAQHEFSVVREADGPTLYMGLDQVKDLTRRTMHNVLRERPFRSLRDFLARGDPRPQEAENLVRVGALDGLGRIPDLLRELKAGDWSPGQFSLFENEAQGGGEDWSLAEKVGAQEALLGASVDAHPLELMADKIAAAGALTTVNAAARVGQRVRVAGMRQTWHRFASAQRGDYIYFMSLEDLEGMLDVVIFGDVYRRRRSALSTPGPFVIEGVVELDPARGEPVIRAERVWRVE
jgi:DNA-directed DNA polymerase III PolC